MPTTTPLIKVERTKSYGAEVILHGDVYDEACAHALALAEEKGYTFIHPFDDPAVATGQGTIAMEIVQLTPAGRLYPRPNRRRRTCNRCFHPCKTPQPTYQGHRRGACRSSLHEGIPGKR